MRLVTLARFRYGLFWGVRKIDWAAWAIGILVAAMMVIALGFVDYVTRYSAHVDKAAVSERQKVKAEAALAHCLNGGSLHTEGSGGFVMCEKSTWVKL